MEESMHKIMSVDEKAKRFDEMVSLSKAGMKPLDLLMAILLVLDPERVRQTLYNISVKGEVPL